MPAAARAVDEHAAVALEVELEHGRWRWQRRLVEQAERRRRALGSRARVRRGERGEREHAARAAAATGARRWRCPAVARPRATAPTIRCRSVSPARPSRAPGAAARAGLERQRADDDVGPARRARAASAADVRGLELGQLAVAGARIRAAGTVARDARGVGRADHVRALGRLVDAQRDAQVRVRADVLADDAARALGREHEVDAEAAAALGDVDDAVDELGDLLARASRTRRSRSRGSRARARDRASPCRAGPSRRRRAARARAGAARRSARRARAGRGGRRGR